MLHALQHLCMPLLMVGYIGPGIGAGAIAVVIGVLASILLAFVGIVWYPIKRLIRGRRANATNSTHQQPHDVDPDGGSVRDPG